MIFIYRDKYDKVNEIYIYFNHPNKFTILKPLDAARQSPIGFFINVINFQFVVIDYINYIIRQQLDFLNRYE